MTRLSFMHHHDNVVFWLSRLHSQNQSVTDEMRKIKSFCHDSLSHDAENVEARI